MKKKYVVYGLNFFAPKFNSEIYNKYLNKIDSDLEIFKSNYSEKELNDIYETLQKSLENGQDFYTNSKPYMKKRMEDYVKELEKGTRF